MFAQAVVSARDTLLRGFTTVRDLGGPSHGIKLAIDQGSIPGPGSTPPVRSSPRPVATVTSGCPTRCPGASPGHLSNSEIIGGAIIADGEAEVLRGTREVLRRGASQVKLMAGGGVASPYDPIDVSQYNQGEFRAAVETAENWGTYVTVHAYTPGRCAPRSARGCAASSTATCWMRTPPPLMAEKGIWWCLQPFLDDEDAPPLAGPNRVKFEQMVAGTDAAYELAIKHQVDVAFGTDILFDAKLATRQGAQLAKLTRWYSPAELLQLATARNAELLALSGPRNPYPGRLGVVEEGAITDLILIDGDPLADISLIARPHEAFTAIIKGGELIKGNRLTATLRALSTCKGPGYLRSMTELEQLGS